MTVALIIGGGRSERMGTDKGELTLEGRTLLERAVDAVTHASLAVIVAPETELRPAEVWPKVRFTLETPPFGGPVAGIAAGVAQLSSRGDEEEVIVLPIDAPAVAEAVGELSAAKLGRDGVVLQDQQGWPQYLLGRYRLGSLRRALFELGKVRHVSMRRFGDLLQVNRVAVDNRLTIDVDTPEQAKEAGIALPHPGSRRTDDPAVFERLERWRAKLSEALEIDGAPIDVPLILRLAEIIAADVARPAVPVTAYSVGVAVGRAIGRGEDVEAMAERAFELAMDPEGTAPDLG